MKVKMTTRFGKVKVSLTDSMVRKVMKLGLRSLMAEEMTQLRMELREAGFSHTEARGMIAGQETIAQTLVDKGLKRLSKK